MTQKTRIDERTDGKFLAYVGGLPLMNADHSNKTFGTRESAFAAAVRELYQRSCFGAGAEVRRNAREALRALAADFRINDVQAVQALGLDIAAYFATRPLEG